MKSIVPLTTWARMSNPHQIYIGFDSREAELSDICAHSIKRRTQSLTTIRYLKHRDLRKKGWFLRPWAIRSTDGESVDGIDNKPFSTEFSHSRFLIPALTQYQGWALFCDADMVFLSDIEKLFALRDERYAVMCVQHKHQPPQNVQKMDGRLQLQYFRKNWSSFVLWNCGHPSNAALSVEKVNTMMGADLHSFKWLRDSEIGGLPFTYNYISGVSPEIRDKEKQKIDVIHYTEGGPWFDGYKDVPLGEIWEREKRDWVSDGGLTSDEGIKARKEERWPA
jgi:hypothetical protein